MKMISLKIIDTLHNFAHLVPFLFLYVVSPLSQQRYDLSVVKRHSCDSNLDINSLVLILV